MIINYPLKFKCSECGCEDDFILFGFTAHSYKSQLTLGENPSDIQAILMCPNLHISGIDTDGTVCKVESPDKIT